VGRYAPIFSNSFPQTHPKRQAGRQAGRPRVGTKRDQSPASPNPAAARPRAGLKIPPDPWPLLPACLPFFSLVAFQNTLTTIFKVADNLNTAPGLGGINPDLAARAFPTQDPDSAA
jgi:hypothetical protein